MDYDSSLLTQTQDPMALEMAVVRDDSPPMNREHRDYNYHSRRNPEYPANHEQ